MLRRDSTQKGLAEIFIKASSSNFKRKKKEDVMAAVTLFQDNADWYVPERVKIVPKHRCFNCDIPDINDPDAAVEIDPAPFLDEIKVSPIKQYIKQQDFVGLMSDSLLCAKTAAELDRNCLRQPEKLQDRD